MHLLNSVTCCRTWGKTPSAPTCNRSGGLYLFLILWWQTMFLLRKITICVPKTQQSRVSLLCQVTSSTDLFFRSTIMNSLSLKSPISVSLSLFSEDFVIFLLWAALIPWLFIIIDGLFLFLVIYRNEFYSRLMWIGLYLFSSRQSWRFLFSLALFGLIVVEDS